MSLDRVINNLDWWQCGLLAFIPAVLVALLALPIGFRLSPESDDANERGRLISLVAAAFAFIVAFSTNTLWSQDLAIAQSARTVGQSSDEMIQAAQDVNDQLASGVRTQLEVFDEYSARQDVVVGIGDESSGIGGVLNELSSTLTQGPQSTPATAAAYETFHAAYKQYLLDLNSPSIPNLILLVIVVLGAIMAGAIASSPKKRTNLASRGLLALSVFVIGLYQFPLWVLSSRKIVVSAVHPYLTTVDGSEAPSGGGFGLTALMLLLALVALLALFVVPGVLLRRRESPE